MITIDTILKSVCAVMDLQPEQVLVPRKTRGAKANRVAMARRVAMFLAKQLIRVERKTITKVSKLSGHGYNDLYSGPDKMTKPVTNKAIGEYFCSRNHSTVTIAMQVVDFEIRQYRESKELVIACLHLLSAVQEKGEQAIDEYIKNRTEIFAQKYAETEVKNMLNGFLNK